MWIFFFVLPVLLFLTVQDSRLERCRSPTRRPLQPQQAVAEKNNVVSPQIRMQKNI
jgi:hypothetical protein